MDKTVPVWVVSEFTAISSDKSVNTMIKDSVRRYVKDEYDVESEFESKLDARSTKPENFKIEGYDKTVGEVLDIIDTVYDILVDINGVLRDNNIEHRDLDKMDSKEIIDILGRKRVNNLRLKIHDLPDEVGNGVAKHTRDTIGGRGNEPNIGPAGDAMYILWKDEFRGN